jgi:hypothetical protein
MVNVRTDDANGERSRSEHEGEEECDRADRGRGETAVASARGDETENDAGDGAQPHEGHAGGALDATLAPSRMK